MIEYDKYRSRYASRIDPITRDRLDLGMSIEETIGYEAVYDHFILVRNLTDGIDLIKIINHLYKKYNVNLSVDHLTEQHNDYMSLVIFYDKDDNEIFNLKIAHDISMLMYDIKNQKFFVINVNDLQQLYVKEKETELFRD